MPPMTISNRVPSQYFMTTGKGEWPQHSTKGARSSLSEDDPFETGSYDVALTDAGIENANVMKYTSVIPRKAKRITKAKGTKGLVWGQVLESIMARADGKHGDRIAAAVMLTNVSHNGKHLGGFATEYSGDENKAGAIATLVRATRGMIKRRGYGDLPARANLFGGTWRTSRGYEVSPGAAFVYDSLDVRGDTGTVLAAVCFTAFDVQILGSTQTTKRPHRPRRRRKTRR